MTSKLRYIVFISHSSYRLVKVCYSALYNPENIAGTKYDSQFNKSKCELGCEREHRLIDCTIYVNMSLEQKRRFIGTTLRCFICLGKNHAARNWPKRKDN